MKKMKKPNKFSKFISKILVCIIIVLIGLILLKSNQNARDFIYKNIFQNNLKFAKINALYEKYFGSSLPLTGSKQTALVSEEKIEYSKLEKYNDGVKLKVEENYAVPILNSGIVIFAGEKEGHGKTVIIEGADEVDIWYSNLKDIKVSMYDYLKKGSIIGEVNNQELILQFTKGGKPLDYKKYI